MRKSIKITEPDKLYPAFKAQIDANKLITEEKKESYIIELIKQLDKSIDDYTYSYKRTSQTVGSLFSSYVTILFLERITIILYIYIMKTSADILDEKQAILNFISESNDSNLISRLKEVVDSFRSSKQDDDIVIPEWHKDLVRERIKNSKPEQMISREELDNLITI